MAATSDDKKACDCGYAMKTWQAVNAGNGSNVDCAFSGRCFFYWELIVVQLSLDTMFTINQDGKPSQHQVATDCAP